MTEREALAALAHEHWRAMLHFYDDPSNRGTNCRQCDALTLFAERATQDEAGLDVERLRQAAREYVDADGLVAVDDFPDIAREYAATPNERATHPREHRHMTDHAENIAMKLHATTDAQVWTEEFDKIYPNERPDTETMRGWFANAIEVGRIAGERAPQAEDAGEWRRLVEDGIEAFRLTREYVGEDTLPAIQGWSWFDWTQRAAAALAVTPEEPVT